MREPRAREKRENQALAVSFKLLDLDTPTGGCYNQIVLVGRSPAPHGFGAYHFKHVMKNKSLNIYVTCYHMFTHL